MEKEAEVDAPEGTTVKWKGLGNVGQNCPGPVSRKAAAGLRQTVGIHVQERDPGLSARKPAMVREVAGPCSGLKVVRTGVCFKKSAKHRRWRLPGKMIADT
jgi:hypothetical protein